MIRQVAYDHTANRSVGQVEDAGLVYACAVDDGDSLDGVERGGAMIWTTTGHHPGPNEFYQGAASQLLAPAEVETLEAGARAVGAVERQ